MFKQLMCVKKKMFNKCFRKYCTEIMQLQEIWTRIRIACTCIVFQKYIYSLFGDFEITFELKLLLYAFWSK